MSMGVGGGGRCRGVWSAKWWRWRSQILSPGNDAEDLVAPGEAEE